MWKRIDERRLIAACCLAMIALVGCRAKGERCPVTVEMKEQCFSRGGYTGVDLLIVIDKNMAGVEQEVLTTGVYSLVNTLLNPAYSQDWWFLAIDEARVAVVTSDLGLSYGDPPSTEGFPYGLTIGGCTDRAPLGEDGRFQTVKASVVNPTDGVLPCDPDGGQCPSDWTCEDDRCAAPGGVTTTICPSLGTEARWVETGDETTTSQVATAAACLFNQAMDGCGVEQQLAAPLRGLSRDDAVGFLKPSHLLAVLVVSDEDDCSVADPGLFATDDFHSLQSDVNRVNVACNSSDANIERFLFDTERYREKLLDLKNGLPNSVLFGAIVGVPDVETLGGEPSPCEGDGTELDECLSHDLMQLREQREQDVMGSYVGFAPACTRSEQGYDVVRGLPGRRFVEVARSFGRGGHVLSICNPDWSPIVEEIATILSGNPCSSCTVSRHPWERAPQEERDALGCSRCGRSSCQLVADFLLKDGDAVAVCSFELEEGASASRVTETASDGETLEYLRCPLPALPAPLPCDEAAARYPEETDAFGWYYCENFTEDYDIACADGLDNDGDGRVDGEDEDCAACVSEAHVGCLHGCRYEEHLTEVVQAHSYRADRMILLCPVATTPEDDVCREREPEQCRDGIDNDGDGLLDCEDLHSETAPKQADPDCCPLEELGTDQFGVNQCRLLSEELDARCGTNTAVDPDAHIPAACRARAEQLECFIIR